MNINNATETVIRIEIAKHMRSIAKLEGMLPGARRAVEPKDRLAVRATDIYDYVNEADGDDFTETPQVTGYVVSNPDGYEEYESEDFVEAYAYLDSAEGEDGWMIGTVYSDGSTSYERQPRRPAASGSAFS